MPETFGLNDFKPTAWSLSNGDVYIFVVTVLSWKSQVGCHPATHYCLLSKSYSLNYPFYLCESLTVPALSRYRPRRLAR
jgi:hypothetical protein